MSEAVTELRTATLEQYTAHQAFHSGVKLEGMKDIDLFTAIYRAGSPDEAVAFALEHGSVELLFVVLRRTGLSSTDEPRYALNPTQIRDVAYRAELLCEEDDSLYLLGHILHSTPLTRDALRIAEEVTTRDLEHSGKKNLLALLLEESDQYEDAAYVREQLYKSGDWKYKNNRINTAKLYEKAAMQTGNIIKKILFFRRTEEIYGEAEMYLEAARSAAKAELANESPEEAVSRFLHYAYKMEMHLRKRHGGEFEGTCYDSCKDISFDLWSSIGGWKDEAEKLGLEEAVSQIEKGLWAFLHAKHEPKDWRSWWRSLRHRRRGL